MIAEIRPGDMKGLSKLKILDLSQNNIENISKIVKHCHELTELYLIGNRITELPEKFYANLNKLQQLHLSGNPITELSADIRKLSNLKVLGISFTKIQQLNRSITELTQLTRLLVENTSLVVFNQSDS
jgi:internalin A